MDFEWDAAKNRSNLAKHGIAFEDAIEVFEDPERLTEPAHLVAGEVRYQTLGIAARAVVLVVHTPREHGPIYLIRVISARPASRQERLRYERGKDRSV